MRALDVRCLRREVVERVVRTLVDVGVTPAGVEGCKTRINRDLVLWIDAGTCT